MGIIKAETVLPKYDAFMEIRDIRPKKSCLFPVTLP